MQSPVRRIVHPRRLWGRRCSYRIRADGHLEERVSDAKTYREKQRGTNRLHMSTCEGLECAKVMLQQMHALQESGHADDSPPMVAALVQLDRVLPCLSYSDHLYELGTYAHKLYAGAPPMPQARFALACVADQTWAYFAGMDDGVPRDTLHHSHALLFENFAEAELQKIELALINPGEHWWIETVANVQEFKRRPETW